MMIKDNRGFIPSVSDYHEDLSVNSGGYSRFLVDFEILHLV